MQFGADSCGSKEPCITFPEGRGRGHMLAHYSMTEHECIAHCLPATMGKFIRFIS